MDELPLSKRFRFSTCPSYSIATRFRLLDIALSETLAEEFVDADSNEPEAVVLVVLDDMEEHESPRE